MSAIPPDDIVTLKLSCKDVGQILDGLCVRRDTWRYTQQYLESGYVNIEHRIEECSDPEEAKNTADYYDDIIQKIRHQLVTP